MCNPDRRLAASGGGPTDGFLGVDQPHRPAPAGVAGTRRLAGIVFVDAPRDIGRDAGIQGVIGAAQDVDEPGFQPRNRSWTRPRVRLIEGLPRSNDDAGRGLQGGARAKSLPRQRLYESGLPLAGTKAGARAGVSSGA
jgi:hypothetical protein